MLCRVSRKGNICNIYCYIHFFFQLMAVSIYGPRGQPVVRRVGLVPTRGAEPVPILSLPVMD